MRPFIHISLAAILLTAVFMTGCAKNAGIESEASWRYIEFGEPMNWQEGDCEDPQLICGGSKAKQTSIVALLGDPVRWKGKIVQVDGYIYADLHGTYLFFSEDHCWDFRSSYGIQIVEPDGVEDFGGQMKGMECADAAVQGIYKPDLRTETTPGDIVIRESRGIIYSEYLSVWGEPKNNSIASER